MLENESIKRFFEKTTWQIFAAVFSGLLAFIAIIGKLIDSNKTVAILLSDAVTLNPTTHQPQLRWWFMPVEFAVLTITLGLIMMVAWAIRRHYVQSDEQFALEEFMRSIRQIMDQSKQTEVIKSWDSLTFTYLINKDLSGSLTRRLSLRAVDRPVHFWESIVTAAEEAEPAKSLAAVKYRVRNLNPSSCNIVYVPSENQSKRKKACLFFLPPIQPQETRDFEISFHWPGLFRRLKKNPEEFEFESRSKEMLGLYRLEVYLEEGAPGRLDCSIIGPPHDGETLREEKYESPTGWLGRGYIYEAKRIPAGKARFVVSAKLLP